MSRKLTIILFKPLPGFLKFWLSWWNTKPRVFGLAPPFPELSFYKTKFLAVVPFFLFFRRLGESSFFWLIFTAGFTLLYYFTEHEGFYFGDDYAYSLYAHQLLYGGFHFDDYSFCHRFMVFVPTALLYWLWGMNIYITTLWPLLCTLATYLCLYLTFRKQHPIATSWALVLLGLYYFQLNTVNYLYPDNILLFFTFTCLLTLYKARLPFANIKSEIWYGFLFAVLNLFAFLTKETIVYAMPFYLLFFFYHTLRKENLKFWGVAIITGALLLTTYFLLYEMYSGEAWQRFYDISTAGRADTGQEYFASRSKMLLSRLTYGPFLFFIGSGLIIPLAFAAMGLFYNKRFSLRLVQPFGFWTLASLLMLLPIWFGSVSLEYYKPMPLVPRMFHPLLPAFCLTAGLAIEKTWGRNSSYAFLALLFAISTWLAGEEMRVMYLPLALFFTLLFLWRFPVPHWIGLAAVVAVCLIRPIYFISKPTVSYYFEQKRIIDELLSNQIGNKVVLADSIMLHVHPFFYGFKVPKNYSFQPYSAANKEVLQKADTVFLLINNGVLEHPELMMPLKEKDILPRFPQAQMLRQEGKVKLFLLPMNRD